MRDWEDEDPGAEDWQELVRLTPTDPVVRARHAAALIREGKYAEAEAELDVCLALAPNSPRPRLLLVVLRTRLRFAARRAGA